MYANPVMETSNFDLMNLLHAKHEPGANNSNRSSARGHASARALHRAMYAECERERERSMCLLNYDFESYHERVVLCEFEHDVATLLAAVVPTNKKQNQPV